MEKGLFIVTFQTMESREKVVKEDYLFFDGKPVMIKAWTQDVDFKRDKIRHVPIWVQLNLDFKYWGKGCLTKIMSDVGKFLKVDNATLKREKLQYARVLLEVDISQSFPDEIIFENEKREGTCVQVIYDWKPSFCKTCLTFGHDEQQCRKNRQKIWVPRAKQNAALIVVGNKNQQENEGNRQLHNSETDN